jgi:hypothetical protein
MQLVDVYTLHLESAQAALARLAQVLGAPVRDPSTTRACEAFLGGDDQLIRYPNASFIPSAVSRPIESIRWE